MGTSAVARSDARRTSLDRALTIGQLAQRTGFSTKTIRYYEAVGLLPAPRRRPSGYRIYDDAASGRLAFISRSKWLGLSLEEIRGVLALHDAGTEPCEHVRGLIELQIRRVDDALDQLSEFRRQLGALRRSARRLRAGGAAAVCRIVEHAAIDVSALDMAVLARHRRSEGGTR